MLALDADERLSRLPDEEVLSLAAETDRIVLTYNVGDFARIGRRRAEAGRRHAGLILVVDAHTSHSALVRGVRSLLADRPRQADWIDRIEFLSRG